MKTARILLMAAMALLGVAPCFSQSIVWSGDGDGISWSDPNNWVGQAVPGPANNVFITNGTAETVVISSAVSVESILCSHALTISMGSLTVTGGASALEGALTVSSDTTLSASGPGTSFVSGGSVVADGANLNVSGGAMVTLAGLQAYSTGCGNPSWTVAGPNSVLDLPGLTNITVLYCGDGQRIQAEAGGQVLATNLVSLIGGYNVTVQADGTNSLVNFSDLMTVAGAYPVTFEASDGGTNWVPDLLGGPNVYVTLNPNSTLPVAQLQQLGGITFNGVSASFPALTTMTGNITASGVTVSFAALTDFDGGSISLSGGSVVTIPGLQNYSTGCGNPSWTVAGPNSVLDLPGLTNITVLYCGDGQRIQAEAGGQVLATNLVSLIGGYNVTVQADGTNSLVNFSDLMTVAGAYPVTFEASDGGTNWVPDLLGGPNVYVTLNPNSTLPVAQLQQLGGITFNGVSASFPALTTMTGNITASGVTVSFAALTDFDGGSISLSGGSVVTIAGLQNYSTGCGNPSWTVAGPNSVLDLPGLTNITVLYCGDGQRIQAEAGGQVLATNLASLIGGYNVTVQADGTNSLVNFSDLMTVAGAYPVTFEASDGGTNWVPDLLGGPNVYVTLNPNSTLPVAQLQQLGGITFNGVSASFPALTTMTGNITASGVTVSFAALTDFDGGSISLSGGSVVTIAGLQNYSTGCGNPSWTVAGPNSVLDLPGLTNITVLNCGFGQRIQAEAGGQVLATNLASIEAGWTVTVQADGTNSLIDFGGLKTVAGAYPVTFEASDGGTNWVPDLLGGPNVYVTLNPNSTLPVAQLQQLGGITFNGVSASFPALTTMTGNITASGVTVSFAALTDFDGGSISLSGGSVVTIAGLQNYSTGCGNPSWTVAGPNSVLDLPGLTNITVLNCGFGQRIQAEAGGQVLATNLASIEAGWTVTVQADGTNSLIDFGGLKTVAGAYPVTFEASDGGTNWVPDLLGGPNVYVTLNPNSTLPVAQLQQLAGITASGVTNSFTNLNNFIGGSISLTNGAVVTLPALASYQGGCANVSWQINGAGSVLNLAGLTNLQGSGCGDTLSIEASGGGEVILTNLQSIANGGVAFLSDGAGSAINLTNLSGFVLQSGQGSITAQNGGTILLNNQAFLLANVAINIPTNTPVLPATVIASGTLTLYGTAWHSYRVEEMNTLVPGSPAITILVPLTNSLQAFASAPPPNTAFIITDFVANPPILQLGLTPDSQVQLALYGLTNATYQIQSAANLLPPVTWTPGSVAAMTNAFRIFPETPPAGVMQFYRAQQE